MNPAQWILISAVRFYRYFLSPAKNALLGPVGQCRFSPTCSAYALEALRRHGAIHGSWLGLKRLCRCHPWGGAGLDPVPTARVPSSHSCASSSSRLCPGPASLGR